MTTQTEEVAITEEDLELIKERETNIRQLEVSICILSLILLHTISQRSIISPSMATGPCQNPLSCPETTYKCHSWFELFVCVSVWHHGCKPDIQGPGSDDPRSGRNDWWEALGLLFSGLCRSVKFKTNQQWTAQIKASGPGIFLFKPIHKQQWVYHYCTVHMENFQTLSSFYSMILFLII